MPLYDSIEEIADEWGDLADRTGASPFLHPGWMLAWSRAFAGRSPQALAVRDNAGLAAVLPVERGRASLRSPTNWHTPLFGPVAESEAALADLAKELYAVRAPRVDVGFLTVGSRDAEVLESAAAAAGRQTLKRGLLRSPFIPLEGSWEDFETKLGGRRRRDLARKRRRLGEHVGAGASLEVVTGADALGEPLAAGFRLEGSGWKFERGTAILSRPETRAFYSDIAAWAAERDWLKLLFLRIGDQRVAFDMCLHADSVLYLLKGGFDIGYAKHSPGVILKHETLRWCFAKGIRSYELLGGEAPDKAIWTGSVRERVLLQAFADSPLGRAAHVAYAHGRPLARRLKQRVASARERAGRGA